MYSWIPIYTELAKRILEYRDRQSDLIRILDDLKKNGLPAPPLVDSDDKPVSEIDPFTFFASFNRGITDEKRTLILTYLKKEFKLQSAIPSDFEGIPTVMNLAAWFFPYKEKRNPVTSQIFGLWPKRLSKLPLQALTQSCSNNVSRSERSARRS